MTSLAQFLIFWTQFVATHYCTVSVHDPSLLNQHVVYGGNCTDGFTWAKALHGSVAWYGTSEGWWPFY